jgi:hypothetical protein
MTVIAFILSIFIFNRYVFSSHHHNIAIAVQGNLVDIQQWLALSKMMIVNLNSSIHVFVGVYDSPLSSFEKDCIYYSTCIQLSNTTWTKGRNVLAQNIYDYEERIGLKLLAIFGC